MRSDDQEKKGKKKSSYREKCIGVGICLGLVVGVFIICPATEILLGYDQDMSIGMGSCIGLIIGVATGTFVGFSKNKKITDSVVKIFESFERMLKL